MLPYLRYPLWFPMFWRTSFCVNLKHVLFILLSGSVPKEVPDLCKIDKRFYAKQTLSFVSEFVMIMSIKRDNGLPETVNLILKTTCILEHKNYEGWHKWTRASKAHSGRTEAARYFFKPNLYTRILDKSFSFAQDWQKTDNQRKRLGLCTH